MDPRGQRSWKPNCCQIGAFLLLISLSLSIQVPSRGSHIGVTAPSSSIVGGALVSPAEGEEETLDRFTRAHQAVAAIVIDDLGYDTLDLVTRASDLGYPFTFAIIPLQPYSLEAASLVHQKGHEVIVHLPLEPEEFGANQTPTHFLRSDMDAEERSAFLKHNLRALPHAIGLNNHMGSKASKSKAIADQLMALTRRYGFFFIDSRTTPDSVLHKTALAYGVPSVERDLFLDQDRSPVQIASRLEELFRLATQNGAALGIGHIYPETVDTLESELPRLLSKYPVSLVPASFLVH